MADKHFLVLHNFINDVARKQRLTPPEKRNPPTKRKSEQEWAEKASQGKHAKLLQQRIGNDEFLFCHWVAKSSRRIFRSRQVFPGASQPWTPARGLGYLPFG